MYVFYLKLKYIYQNNNEQMYYNRKLRYKILYFDEKFIENNV